MNLPIPTRIAQLVPTLPGWCPVEKALWLADIIARERLIHVVEIGVFGGRSLLPMALALRQLQVGGFALGIDSYTSHQNVEGFPSTSPHAQWSEQCDYRAVYADVVQQIRDYDLSRVCGVLRAASEDVAALIGMVDLLHLDGCHSVLASCRDVETWLPKVRRDGIIVLDDTDWGSVQEAKSMLRAACGEPGHDGGTWEAYRVR